MDSKIVRFKKKWRAPFTLSGSFSDETLDGWTNGGTAAGSFVSSGARTAPGCMSIAGNLLNRVDLLIPAHLARNRRFNVSVWHKHVNGSGSTTSRAIRYQYGVDGNEAQIILVQDTQTAWRQMSGVLDNPEDREVVIRLFGSCNAGNFQVLFDDWLIEGIPLESIPA